MNTLQNETGFAKRLTALSMSLFIFAGAASPAGAQKRRGEPEANPQFQSQVQDNPSGGGGGPIETPAPAEAVAAPAAAAPEASSGEEEAAPERRVQEVQIGTVNRSARRAAPAAVGTLETRVTVRVHGAPLATFLDTIQAQSNANFIIHSGLESEKVTALLQNVTVREALQVLLEMKGLSYHQIGKSNTYVVLPRAPGVINVITRVYTLSYIPLMPLGDVAQDEASITPKTNAQPAGLTGALGQGGGKPGDQGGTVAIIGVIKSILHEKTGQIAVDPRTNSLIVTDVPEVFPQIEQIISELDKKPPQVLIEAQIVEIDSTRDRELGFEWGSANGELASFTGGQRDTTFPLNLPNKLSNAHFFDPVTNLISAVGGSGATNNQVNATNATSNLVLGNSLKTGILDLTSLKVSLRAMVSRSEARFLGKPKILTLNNKSAIIEVSANQAVGMQLNQSGGLNVGNQTSVAERVDTGLKLKVTPQVNKEGYITMLVQPSFTDVTQSDLSTASNPVFDPVTRGASALVRIRNGQTLVMGGLLRSTENKVVRKVPILGYIPIIGWFFTSSSSRKVNSDLVIFLTPTIVND